MKFLKMGLIILAGVLLLLGMGAGIFIATFDANDYRPMLSKQVKQQTGRELTLDDIKPSVFPWLGIELQGITLNNANGFKAEKMLKIARLDVRVELMPLLMQELHIDTLRLHGLSLFLEKDKKGKTNWNDILEKQAKSGADKSTNAPKAKGSEKNRPDKNRQEKKESEEKESDESLSDLLAVLQVNGVEIKEANITWSDAFSDQAINIQNFNLNTGALRPDKPLPISLSALVELSEPKARVEITLKTQIHLNLKAQRIKLADLNLMIDAVLAQDDIKQLKLNLKTQIDADLNSQYFIVPAYNLDIKAQGQSLPGETLKASIKGDADIDLTKEIAKIKQLSLESAGLKLKSQLVLTKFLTSPELRAELELENFNPKKVAKTLAIELPVTKNETILENANMRLGLIASKEYLEINALKLMLDKTELLADVQVENFEKPRVKFSINVDSINLDDYLPPVEKQSKVQSKKSSGVAAANIDIPIDLPVSMLRSLNVSGEIGVKSLTVSDQVVSNLKIRATAKQGLIKAQDITANLLKGSVISTVQLDVRKNTPRYQFKLKGKGLNAESVVNPILQDIMGDEKVSMSGVTNLNMDIKTVGQSVNQLIAGSNGQFALNMTDATLHGVDATYFVQNAVVDFLQQKKQVVPKDWRGEYKPKEITALKVAKASAVITNGVIDNKDLLLDSSRFKITGVGKINLPEENLDYRVIVDVKPVKIETVGERLLDVPMPVFIKGRFTQPAVSIDSKVWFKSASKELKAEVKQEIKRKLKIQKKEQKKKIKEKLEDKFKGLFR